ncbi:PREDICTED: mitotic spindle assembly checkpoint protein MAD1-like [Amphimedon queenslandica]|uniref:Uncharacterized protein n=1 Tax=Amphimedon queenslandica TaxID=400682 RepID=A0AAN0J5U2_AMPQE|nr:PREDICTED: mitotic spindle assembly checkpoint protein MAD1-like [Amphimedon queenslandica]|eukprot:XP_019852390.1 PREDICTED: mitotic spindle assembly checkpoint protein MAD1-like [Amphimedon queenslandica]
MSTNEEEVGEILEYDELDVDDEEIDELLHLSPSEEMTEQYHKLLTRNHKLEQERRELISQLTSLKESSLYESNSQSTTGGTATSDHLVEIKGELNHVLLEKTSLEEENGYLKKRLELIEDQKQLMSEEMKKLEETSKLNVQKLHNKILECDDIARQLSKSQEKVKELDRKLREMDEEHRLVSISRKRLSDYSDLEQLNNTLTKENEVLKGRVDNNDLLIYQLHTLRDKVAKLEAAQVDYNELVTENKLMKEQLESYSIEGGATPLRSPSLMKLQLIQFQQKDIIQATKLSEMETKLTISDNNNRKLTQEIEHLKEEMTKLNSEIEIKNETIQKLERKNKLIAKEREGCINILNSYKLDIGADSVLKEQVTELEASNERLRARIDELTNEIESKELFVKREKRQRIDYDAEV